MRGTAEEAGTIATTLAIARMNVVGVVTTRMGTITPIGAGTGITVGIVVEKEIATKTTNGGLQKSKLRGRIRQWLLIRVIGSLRIGILDLRVGVAGGGEVG